MHARTEENVTTVDEVVTGTPTKPGRPDTSTSELTQSSVVFIIYRDVGLTCFSRLPKRLFVIIASFLRFIFHKVV